MTEERRRRGISCWLVGVFVVVLLAGGLITAYGFARGWDKVHDAYDSALAWVGIGPKFQQAESITPAPGVPPEVAPAPEQPAPESEIVQAPPSEAELQPESHTDTTSPGSVGLQAPEAAVRPTGILKACIDRLSKDDLIGAEQYVSPNGFAFRRGDTVGAHVVLWKALYGMRAYDEVGYNDLKVTGQTAWIPVYSRIGDKRMAAIYIIVANRGDGWKLDSVVDPKRY